MLAQNAHYSADVLSILDIFDIVTGLVHIAVCGTGTITILSLSSTDRSFGSAANAMNSTLIPSIGVPFSGPLNLNDYLGPFFVGNIVIAVLYGISCVQMYMYHQRSARDSFALRCLIYGLWFLDTAQLVFWTVALYNFCVTNFLNLPALVYAPWSLIVDYCIGAKWAVNSYSAICSSQGSIPVVLFLVNYTDVHRFEQHLYVSVMEVEREIPLGPNRYTGCQYYCILRTCDEAMASTWLGISWGKVQVEEDIEFGWMMLVDFSAKFIGDICIAFSLWMTLRRMRTGVRSISILGTIIALAAAPHTYIYDAFSTILPKMVFNSLLAFLNSREYFSEGSDEPLSIHLSHLPQFASNPSTQDADQIHVHMAKFSYSEDSNSGSATSNK
ncbi:hypothetical protein NM688_g2894 [Phlebia brevispora]|uniref:Uncharacterized protein n=1 Tax=Phlebia brevispora TaxID=194682 RepID=A0ACC1T709_9APHY|nr:hypothetical protein NM688_g2894 [Phlebia brevispora]